MPISVRGSDKGLQLIIPEHNPAVDGETLIAVLCVKGRKPQLAFAYKEGNWVTVDVPVLAESSVPDDH